MVTINANANANISSLAAGLPGEAALKTETETQLTDEQASLLNHLLDALQKLRTKYDEQQQQPNQPDTTTTKALKSLKLLLKMQEFFTLATYQEPLAKLPMATVLSVQAEIYSFIGQAYQKIHAQLTDFALQAQAQASEANKLLTLATEAEAAVAAQVKAKVVETGNSPPAQSENEASEEGESETGAKRWSRSAVGQLTREKVAYALYGGKPATAPISVSEDWLAIQCLRLLGHYGPLTASQLVILLTAASEGLVQTSSSRSSLQSDIYRSLGLMQHQKLVSASKVKTRLMRGRSELLWFMEKPGSIYYQLLVEEETTTETASSLTNFAHERWDASANRGQAEHVWGIGQTLSALAALTAFNRKLASLSPNSGTRLLFHSSHSPNQNQNQPELELELLAPPELTLEIAPAPVYLAIKKEERQRVQPDSMGRLLYTLNLSDRTHYKAGAELTTATAADSQTQKVEWLENALIRNANIDPESDEERFSQFGTGTGGRSGVMQLAWPFLLEYDRSTESLESFGSKYGLYAKLMNIIRTGWPDEWGDKFPVVLVVVDGTLNRMLALQKKIRQEVRADKFNRHKPKAWWFTRMEWLLAVSQPYLDNVQCDGWLKLLATTATTNSSNSTGNSNPFFQAQSRLDLAGRGSEVKKLATKLKWGPSPCIWLPLHQTVSVGQLEFLDSHLKQPLPLVATTGEPEQLARSVATNANANRRTQTEAQLKTAATNLAQISQQLCSLPLPTPLNVSPFSEGRC